MVEKEIPGDLIDSKSCLNLDSGHLKSRYLIIFLNTCTCKVHVSIFNNTYRENNKIFVYLYCQYFLDILRLISLV